MSNFPLTTASKAAINFGKCRPGARGRVVHLLSIKGSPSRSKALSAPPARAFAQWDQYRINCIRISSAQPEQLKRLLLTPGLMATELTLFFLTGEGKRVSSGRTEPGTVRRRDALTHFPFEILISAMQMKERIRKDSPVADSRREKKERPRTNVILESHVRFSPPEEIGASRTDKAATMKHAAE